MKTNIIALFLFSLIHFSASAISVELALNPDKPDALEQVPVPFKFLTIKPKEKFHYVVTAASALMTPESDFSYLVIGPLQPCILVRFYNKSNGHILAFHMHWASSLESMAAVVNAHVGFKDRLAIDVGMFSVHHKGSEDTLATQMPNWNQLDEIKRIRNYIIKNLKVPGPEVRVKLYEKPKEARELGQYNFLYNGYTAIDKDGKFFTIDPFVNDILDISQDKVTTKNASTGELKSMNFTDLPMAARIRYFAQVDDNYQKDTLRNHMGLKQSDALPWQAKPGQHAALRGTIPFFMLAFNVVLQKAPVESSKTEIKE